MKKLKEPVSTGMLGFMGLLVAVMGVLGICAGIASKRIDLVSEGVAAFLGSAIYFGMGKVISSANACAFYLEEIATRMSLAQQSAPQPSSRSPDTGFAVAPGAALYYIERSGGDRRGPMTEGEMWKMRALSAINNETPAFKEGDEEWRTVGDYLK
jgi:hypothetical protein